MSVVRLVLLVVCFLSLNSLFSQAEYDGSLQFVGINMFNYKPLTNTKVIVKTADKLVQELDTKGSNEFKVKLDFGHTYDIYFINAKAQKMFIRIYADIPEKKRNLHTTYALEIPFFPKDASTLDTTQFVNQFHQIVFDGKNKFVDDTVYMNRFLKKVYKPQEEEVKTVVKVEKVKQYVQIAGKLSFDNDKKTPLKRKLVSVINKQGEVIASSLTTNFGVFVFPGIDLDAAEGLTIKLSESENPNHEKVKLETSLGESVDVISSTNNMYQFRKSEASNVIQKLIDPDFKYNVGGKLIYTKGTEKKVAADKEVCLLGNKNNIIQKVKTNALGNFLFTKIIPNQEYSFSFDTSEFGLDKNLSLYSVSDKFIKRIDSTSKNKFVYRFISTSQSSFSDMIVDDSELKMNMKGRLCGDNKNNPLANVKVLLLNDKYETIDTTVTNSNGDFVFNYLSYNRQILISVENEKNLLEAFSNILVFDNGDNLIKLVSMVKGSSFKYKPLSTEQALLSEVYVDDPWLNVINPKTKHGKIIEAKSTIVENILFEFNKSELLPESRQTLDKVILAMTANENFSIELGAHSDSKGGDAYNLKLSVERAKSAKNYIVSKGIEPKRIIAKGYGETKLLNNCGNNVKCSDDEHAVNRRLEFKLIFN